MFFPSCHRCTTFWWRTHSWISHKLSKYRVHIIDHYSSRNWKYYHRNQVTCNGRLKEWKLISLWGKGKVFPDWWMNGTCRMPRIGIVGKDNFKLEKVHKQAQNLGWRSRHSKWLSLAGSWMGVERNMVGKVSWGQIVRNLNSRLRHSNYYWDSDHWGYRFSEWTIEIVNGGMLCSDSGHCTHIPHFFFLNQIKYTCTCFFGWCQEILWYFPRVIFSLYTSKRETEDPMSISKK